MKFLSYTVGRNSSHLTKYLAAALVVASVSLLFPTSAKFNYHFRLGETWLYDDLYANFDYALAKSDEEIQNDQSEFLKDFAPYYELNQETVKEKKKAFLIAFDEQLKIARRDNLFQDVFQHPKIYIDYGNRTIEKLYARGILKQDSFIDAQPKNFVINIIRGNSEEKQTIQNILTADKVKEFLNDSLPNSNLIEPGFLYPLLERLLTPNLTFNEEWTKKIKQEKLESLPASRGMVKKGELIVPKGGVVIPAVYQKLNSYKEQYETDNTSSRTYYAILMGYYLLTSLIIGLYCFYLKYHTPDAFARLRWVVFLLSWIVVYTYITYEVKKTEVLSLLLVPFCIAPIVIKNFYDRELALIAHLTIVLIVGLIVSPGWEFIFLQIIAGWVVIFTRWETRYWSRFFQSIFLLVLFYWLGFIGFALIEGNNWQTTQWSSLVWLTLNGFLTMLAYPLIPLTGNFFGYTSSIALAELSDLNHPLLKELSLQAPGTLHHSLQVSNLAEAAALSIKANALLVKVGALYHDVGKIINPIYFIENQSDNDPHANLQPEESAQIIINHLREGVKLAEKYGLPDVVANFIKTHHGDTVVKVFFMAYKNVHGDAEKNKKLFQYPGPKPRTREEAILMLADSIEAGSKALQRPTLDALADTVEKITADKISQGQLSDSELTFQELETCKDSFKQTLKSIYHIRLEYPSER